MELSAADLSPAKAYHVLTHVVAPRPIAWITSLGPDGTVNAAPFSWFQAVCADPPMVMVSIVDDPKRLDGRKDTVRNVLANRDFVVNIATGDQLQGLVDSSMPAAPDESEVGLLGLGTWPAVAVEPPRLQGCAAHLECRLVDTHRYGRDKATTVLVGEVVHVAMRDELLTERGMLDAMKAALPARLGSDDYLRVLDVFQVKQDMSRR